MAHSCFCVKAAMRHSDFPAAYKAASPAEKRRSEAVWRDMRPATQPRFFLLSREDSGSPSSKDHYWNREENKLDVFA